MASGNATSLEGVWRIVSTRTLDTDGNLIEGHPGPYGPQPFGMITATKDRMIATVGDIATTPSTPNRIWLTYGGPYTFDGAKLVTSPDLASQADRRVDQVRGVRFEKNGQMVLRPPPRAAGGALGEKVVQYELFWEKLA